MRFSRLRSSALLSAVILLPLVAAQNNNPDGTCYFPSGTVAKDYFPCDPNAFITQCCPSGWTCFANSLCVVTDPRTANETLPIATTRRAGCTNALWNNNICGDFCLGTPNDNGTMNACGDNIFCCAADEAAGQCNCEHRTGNTVSVPNGPVQTVLSLANGATATPVFTYHITTSTSTTTDSSVPTDSSAPTATVTPAPDKKNLGVKVGVPVAVVVGVVLLGLLVAWAVTRRRRGGSAGSSSSMTTNQLEAVGGGRRNR